MTADSPAVDRAFGYVWERRAGGCAAGAHNLVSVLFVFIVLFFCFFGDASRSGSESEELRVSDDAAIAPRVNTLLLCVCARARVFTEVCGL